MNFSNSKDFDKDFKKLSKKYKSLKEDLSLFKKFISKIPLGNSKHFNIIFEGKCAYVLKARLACQYLKGSSLRIIYSYNAEEKHIEFIELYYKGNQENHTISRISSCK
jgi:hypothetical protein